MHTGSGIEGMYPFKLGLLNKKFLHFLKLKNLKLATFNLNKKINK